MFFPDQWLGISCFFQIFLFSEPLLRISIVSGKTALDKAIGNITNVLENTQYFLIWPKLGLGLGTVHKLRNEYWGVNFHHKVQVNNCYNLSKVCDVIIEWPLSQIYHFCWSLLHPIQVSVLERIQWLGNPTLDNWLKRCSDGRSLMSGTIDAPSRAPRLIWLHRSEGLIKRKYLKKTYLDHFPSLELFLNFPNFH